MSEQKMQRILTWFIVTGLGVMQSIVSLGQKKENLDTSVIKEWSWVSDGVISPDGKWAGYILHEGPYKQQERFILRNLDTRDTLQLGVLSYYKYFSKNDRYFIYATQKNELTVLNLSTKMSDNIGVVESFDYMSQGSFGIVIFKKAEKLIELDLRTKEVRSFPNIEKYKIIDSCLVLVSKVNGIRSVAIVTPKKIPNQIWSGSCDVDNIFTSSNGEWFGFKADNKFWLSNLSGNTFETSFSQFVNIENLIFNGISYITNTGDLVLDYLEPERTEEIDINLVQIFSFQDAEFSLDEKFRQEHYMVLYQVASNKLIRLWNKGEFLLGGTDDHKFIIIGVGFNRSIGPEYYWNQKQEGARHLVSLKTGQRVSPDIKCEKIWISPSERYIIFKKHLDHVWSYDRKSGGYSNLTEMLPIPTVDNIELELGPGVEAVPVIYEPEWVNEGDKMLVKDKYDYWVIDPGNKHYTLSLTNGFGRRNNLDFKLLSSPKLLTEGDFCYLSAFNMDNKQSGFYKTWRGSLKNPEKVTMDRNNYSNYRNSSGPNYNDPPKKSLHSNRWLVNRGAAGSSNNYFWTSDFKRFHSVSNIHPEENYYWYTTELINYTTKDGIRGQAILYKPENLDSSKKYPVLFNFYEERTSDLNQFVKVAYATSNTVFNFPLMLANGYLICVPDIHFKIGKPALSIVDCIESAADAISTRDYVDTAHFGASGGSMGGYEVNCLAAFSHRFQAFVSISGISDLISKNGLVPGNRDEDSENRQMRMGTSLSRDPESYLHNSPVAYAKDVTRPILIVNTIRDGNVNVQQGIEWFISLRREGKQAWMLRYQQDTHGVEGEAYQRDLYLRMLQFFNHYLKGASSPKWMMDGLPMRQRSGTEGFQLEPTGVEPGPGLNTEKDLQRRNTDLESILIKSPQK